MRRTAIVVSLLMAGCSGSRVGKVSINEDLIKLIPPDTVSLAGGRMEALRSTDVYKKYYAMRRLPLMEDLRASTGVDPGAELNEFLTASDNRDSITMALAGSPDVLKKLDRGGSGSAVIQEHIGVIGSGSRIAQAVKGPWDGTIPADLRTLIEEIPSNPHLWAVSTRPRSPLGGSLPSNRLGGMDRLFTGMDSASAWVLVSDSVQVGAIAHCSSEDAAKKVESSIQALIALARLAGSSRKGAADVLEEIQLKREARTVKIDLDLPASQLEMLTSLYGR
jgi:hypothetical protein